MMRMLPSHPRRLRLMIVATAVLLNCIGLVISASEVDGIRVEVNNATTAINNVTDSRSDSFADIIDRALEKEFPENDDQTTG